MHARVGARPRVRRLSDNARHETEEEEEEVEDRDISRAYTQWQSISGHLHRARGPELIARRRLPVFLPSFLPSSRCRFPSHAPVNFFAQSIRSRGCALIVFSGTASSLGRSDAIYGDFCEEYLGSLVGNA